jgi:glycosyltransferase involved in cell wall biosynthesis
MRVAIIAEVFLPKIDGVVHRTLNLIEQLQAAGDDLIIAFPYAEGERDCDLPLVDFKSFPFITYPEYKIGIPDHRLEDAIREFQPDVIHYMNPLAFGFRCYNRLRKAGLNYPSMFSFHTLYGEFVKGYAALRPLSPIIWWTMREFHNRADMNMTVSGLMRDELIERNFERVELWPPAVNVEQFHPRQKSDEMRNRLTQGRPEKPLLLTVSRLAPEKNVLFLKEIVSRFPDATLAVVGDGPQRGELEKKFANLDACFFGYLTGDELAAAYASSDLFLYASETETMGNVVLEGMATGCPVVVPRAGGIPSLVEHEKTGLLYEPRNVDDACSHVEKLLGDTAYREQIGNAAYETVKNWDWPHAIERVREVYQESIDRFDPDMAGSATMKQRLAGMIVSSLVTTFGCLGKTTKPPK